MSKSKKTDLIIAILLLIVVAAIINTIYLIGLVNFLYHYMYSLFAVFAGAMYFILKYVIGEETLNECDFIEHRKRMFDEVNSDIEEDEKGLH